MPETASMVTVPKIEIYGVGDLNRLRKFVFEGEIDQQIGNYGSPLEDIHGNSIALRDEAALWNAYLLSKSGKLELPEEVRKTVYSLFESRGYGNVTDDACNYDKGDTCLKKIHDTDRRVQWIVHPEFNKEGNAWKATLREDSEVHNILVPEPGYARRTNDGPYRPDTGTPFETVRTRAEAEKSWTDKGFDTEFAKEAVSYWHSRNEGEGTAAVFRWYFDEVVGRFIVCANCGPDFRSGAVGSFPASRLPSGARRVSDKGTVVLSSKEYNSLIQTVEKLAADLKNLQE